MKEALSLPFARSAPPLSLPLGDLNWTEELNGPLQLLEGWSDVWASLRPGEPGLTFDRRANAMIADKRGWRGGRLDRVLARLGGAFEPVVRPFGWVAWRGGASRGGRGTRSSTRRIDLMLKPL